MKTLKISPDNKKTKNFFDESTSKTKRIGEAGFSLVEAVCAMVILLITLIGVFTTFTYAVNYNAGNNSRAQALAVLQQEMELLRSKKFTPEESDDALKGGTKPEKVVTVSGGNRFRVNVLVDNNPLTAPIENEDVVTSIKQITVTVTLDSPTPGWQTSLPTTAILRRVRSN